jgi:hypothetical protein
LIYKWGILIDFSRHQKKNELPYPLSIVYQSLDFIPAFKKKEAPKVEASFSDSY